MKPVHSGCKANLANAGYCIGTLRYDSGSWPSFHELTRVRAVPLHVPLRGRQLIQTAMYVLQRHSSSISSEAITIPLTWCFLADVPLFEASHILGK